MVNALFSSKISGTKLFQRSKHSTFGWEAIMDLYKREVARTEAGLTRMVPRLKEPYCIRDSWTKLNATPSKIMQVAN